MSILRKFFKKFQEGKDLTSIKPYTLYPDTKIQYVTEFKDGYALALIGVHYRSTDTFSNDNLLIAILDTNYEISLYTKYFSFGEWYNGYLIAFNYGYDFHESCVLLDKNLKEVPNLRYRNFYPINDYLEVAVSCGEKTYGLLDKDLKLILPASYSKIRAISENRFFCESKDEENVVFDAIEKQTFKVPIANSIYDEDVMGFYKFRSKNNTLGYFDNNFEVAIKPIYQSLGNFDSHGYASFVRDGIVGVIDRTGKEFIR